MRAEIILNREHDGQTNHHRRTRSWNAELRRVRRQGRPEQVFHVPTVGRSRRRRTRHVCRVDTPERRVGAIGTPQEDRC